MTSLPDDLHGAITTLGYYAVPANIDQAAASASLKHVVDGGITSAIPEALRSVGRTYTHDAGGRIVPSAHNWVMRTAYLLSRTVDEWLDKQMERAA